MVVRWTDDLYRRDAPPSYEESMGLSAPSTESLAPSTGSTRSVPSHRFREPDHSILRGEISTLTLTATNSHSNSRTTGTITLSDYVPDGSTAPYIVRVPLTLREIFTGGKQVFISFKRYSRSGRSKEVRLTLDVPQGCPDGARFTYDNAGHELPNGRRQDIEVVIAEESPAPTDQCGVAGQVFYRDGDDLHAHVCLPWTSRLERKACKFHIKGLDGARYEVEVDYRRTRMVNGVVEYRGKGMPRDKREGRGSLYIEWEIVFPDGQ
ncbi:hypothetical protein D9611_001466 [Ephemerocybe angulata]|uniref:Chaperone DnaJ C-terminal domain-containing protein n=1 Tax=Ephemerocybe angulata TaxID=980116 RepID=A0A8H5CH37_9AGAR|nr:hypothetical protein D9611_001466 [Tulosesus angulatus]